MNDIKRGEMFYISRGGASYNGSEQHADRPAVVVSNNKNNENSNVVEVVYMTTQPKTDLPTHVTIRSTGRISTVLCEQVYSVSTERIGTYIGEATDKEMENIDIALMISLQLDNGIKTAKEYYKTIKEQQEEIDSLKKEVRNIAILNVPPMPPDGFASCRVLNLDEKLNAVVLSAGYRNGVRAGMLLRSSDGKIVMQVVALKNFTSAALVTKGSIRSVGIGMEAFATSNVGK